MKKIALSLFSLFCSVYSYSQCFIDSNGKRTVPVTAAYATGGIGKYKEEILWLTWGATKDNQSTNPYGVHNVTIKANDTSNAEIKLGENKYICVQVKIVSTSESIKSYRPGDYQSGAKGDYLDEIYNIGGTYTSNKLIAGISGSSVEPLIKFTGRAFISENSIDDQGVKSVKETPIKIPGLIFADAESLNSTGEYIKATADGDWNIVEYERNTTSTNNIYNVKKSKNTSGNNTIHYTKGSDLGNSAINLLNFHTTAYNTTDYSVNFEAQFKGGGTQAISLGLLTPYGDLGDAPISYGNPMHLFESLQVVEDKLVTNTESNLTTSGTSILGSLESESSNYIGSTAPRVNSVAVNSNDAKGDDYDKKGNEEDGWPAKYQGFSYKTVSGSQYPVGAVISADIPVVINKKSVLAGWIDFNVNGVFEEKERVYQVIEANQTGNIKLDWKIPVNRKPYSTFVRLRLYDYESLTVGSTFNPSLITATSDVLGGEVEDHEIKIFGQMVSNPMILNSSPTYKN